MSREGRHGTDRSHGPGAAMPLAILGAVNLLMIPKVVAIWGPDSRSMISVLGREVMLLTLYTAVTLAVFTAGYFAIGIADFVRSRRSSSPMTTIPLLVVGAIGAAVQWWMFLAHQPTLLSGQWLTYVLYFKGYGLLTIACSITVLAFWRRSPALLAVVGVYFLSLAPKSYSGLFGTVRTHSTWVEFAVPASVLLVAALAFSPAAPRLTSWHTTRNREVDTT